MSAERTGNSGRILVLSIVITATLLAIIARRYRRPPPESPPTNPATQTFITTAPSA